MAGRLCRSLQGLAAQTFFFSKFSHQARVILRLNWPPRVEWCRWMQVAWPVDLPLRNRPSRSLRLVSEVPRVATFGASPTWTVTQAPSRVCTWDGRVCRVLAHKADSMASGWLGNCWRLSVVSLNGSKEEPRGEVFKVQFATMVCSVRSKRGLQFVYGDSYLD